MSKIKFVDNYQTPLNAGLYKVTATLDAPENLAPQTSMIVKLFVAGPRFFLPPSEIHSVFPPENGEGDYNNILPHVVLNRHSLPWERLVSQKNKDNGNKLEEIPFLALLVFNEDEEASGEVTPPTAISVNDLRNYTPEPGEQSSDKVNVIDVKRNLLEHIMPTGDELSLLSHGREITEDETLHQRAVVISNRLPVSNKRNIAHLVMLENRFVSINGEFKFASNIQDTVRLVCLKSWQFNCSGDKPTLIGRMSGNAFTFDLLCVPKPDNTAFEQIRSISYAALPYHLRWGDRTHTLYHGPLVAQQATDEILKAEIPVSADNLTRILSVNESVHIFDVSLAAAWQLGRLLMLRDTSIAMEYFGWRRRDAQLRAREDVWKQDGHLRLADNHSTGLTSMPDTLSDWFKERLALRGLPFEYLIPDTRMLPENSLRLFQIHEGWMRFLCCGALALGRAGETDRKLEADYLKMIFPNSTGAQTTGFLLRSPAVDEHPDLKVAAFAFGNDQTPLTPVRLERIAPGLFLGLFTGTISKLQFSLPPIGLHFGFKETNLPGQQPSFAKDLRDQDGKENNSIEKITMRSTSDVSPGGSVVDVKTLVGEMNSKLGVISETMTPGGFAFQMCEGTEMVSFEDIKSLWFKP